VISDMIFYSKKKWYH